MFGRESIVLGDCRTSTNVSRRLHEAIYSIGDLPFDETFLKKDGGAPLNCTNKLVVNNDGGKF